MLPKGLTLSKAHTMFESFSSSRSLRDVYHYPPTSAAFKVVRGGVQKDHKMMVDTWSYQICKSYTHNGIAMINPIYLLIHYTE